MKHYKIAVVPGDGTGPEVIAEGMKVLNAAERKFGFTLDATTYDVGAGRYLATGEILPDSVLKEFRGHDAMFLGAIGDPRVKPGILEKGILLRMRFELDQYINLRPIRLYPGVDTPLKGKGPADIDYCVVRENSGGLYTGMGGISRPDSKDAVATQIMAYTYEQVEYVSALEPCLRGGRRRISRCGAAVLPRRRHHALHGRLAGDVRRHRHRKHVRRHHH